MSGVDLDGLRRRLWLHGAAVAVVCLIGAWFIADGQPAGFGMVAVALLTLIPVHIAARAARRRP